MVLSRFYVWYSELILSLNIIFIMCHHRLFNYKFFVGCINDKSPNYFDFSFKSIWDVCSHDSQTNHSLRHRTLALATWNQGKLEILRIDQLFYAFKASRRCTTVQVIKKEAQISSQYHTCRNPSRRSQYRLRQCQSQILRHILILFLHTQYL